MREYGRKVMALFLAVTMAFSMAACGGEKGSTEKAIARTEYWISSGNQGK